MPHPQRRLAGVMRNPSADRKQPAAHRRGPCAPKPLRQRVPKQHRHAACKRTERQPQRIGLMIAARHPPAGKILPHLPEPILAAAAAPAVPAHNAAVVPAVQYIQMGPDRAIHMPVAVNRLIVRLAPHLQPLPVAFAAARNRMPDVIAASRPDRTANAVILTMPDDRLGPAGCINAQPGHLHPRWQGPDTALDKA